MPIGPGEKSVSSSIRQRLIDDNCSVNLGDCPLMDLRGQVVLLNQFEPGNAPVSVPVLTDILWRFLIDLHQLQPNIMKISLSKKSQKNNTHESISPLES